MLIPKKIKRRRVSRGKKIYVLKRRQCSECKWCESLEDSECRTIYICLDGNSPNYFEEVGIMCSCIHPFDNK